MKFKETTYGGIKEILKHKDFNAVSVMVDDTGIVANTDGKKIVPAGTIVGGATKAVLQNPDEPVVEKNEQGVSGAVAEGVLLYDVDVTYGKAPGSMIIRGDIDQNKIPAAPCADALTALKGRILFVK